MDPPTQVANDVITYQNTKPCNGTLFLLVVLTFLMSVQLHLFFGQHLSYNFESSDLPPTQQRQRYGNGTETAVAVITDELQPAPQQSIAYSDTAIYFNMNTNLYGIYSTSKSSQTVDVALKTSDVLWLINNWSSIMAPSMKAKKTPYKFVMDIVKEKMVEHNMTIKLLITDSYDTGAGFLFTGSPLHKCILLASELLGPDNVYLASRTLVTNRNYTCFGKDHGCTTGTFLGDVNGTVLDYRKMDIVNHLHNGVVAQWDFCLRHEYVQLFDQIVREKLGLNGNATLSLSDFSNYERVRVSDVAHIWDITYDHMSAFRNLVTATIHEVSRLHNLTGVAGLVSPMGRIGRTTTSRLYADALLKHKIIVVAQRDGWEGHLRLFESLLSGAMVLSDPITFPPAGLVDGKNIIYYTSLDDLVKKVLYFLRDENGCRERDRIAQAGRDLVLKHHKAHHRFERLMLRDNWPKKWTNPVASLL